MWMGKRWKKKKCSTPKWCAGNEYMLSWEESHSVSHPKTVTTELFIFVKQRAANVKTNNVYMEKCATQLRDEKKEKRKKQSRQHTQCHSGRSLTHTNALSFDQRTIPLAFHDPAIAYGTYQHSRRTEAKAMPKNNNKYNNNFHVLQGFPSYLICEWMQWCGSDRIASCRANRIFLSLPTSRWQANPHN